LIGKGGSALDSEILRETRGVQPSQQMSFNKKKYQKIVRSHPMDLQRVVQPSDPLNSINHTSETMGTSHQHAMTGGKLV